MKNIKWSYFEDEDGNKTNVAAVNGYDFRDRMLENVFFNITINNEGKLEVKVSKDAEPYFSQFKESPIYKDALEFAETNDIFHAKDGNGDSELVLYSAEGKLNTDYLPIPPKPMVIKMSSPADIFKEMNNVRD